MFKDLQGIALIVKTTAISYAGSITNISGNVDIGGLTSLIYINGILYDPLFAATNFAQW
jgi:hypothetical protein